MNRKLAFLLGLLLGASFVKLLRRRRAREDTADPRASELRRKLADTRAEAIATAEPVGTAQPPVGEPDNPGSRGIEGLRRRVYEEGRAAAEEMRRSGEESPHGDEDQ